MDDKGAGNANHSRPRHPVGSNIEFDIFDASAQGVVPALPDVQSTNRDAGVGTGDRKPERSDVCQQTGAGIESNPGKLVENASVPIGQLASKQTRKGHAPTRRPNDRWSTEEDALLCERHAAGDNYQQIADKLGRPHSGVCGRAFRLGLAVSKKPPLSTTHKKPQPKWREVLFASDNEIPHRYRCQALDLTAHRCHWPVGDPHRENFFFCGVPIEPATPPYCPIHQQRATGQRSNRAGATNHVASEFWLPKMPQKVSVRK